MLISGLIQAQNSVETVHENVQDASVHENEDSGKANSDVFAKLMDGLTGKTKKNVLDSPKNEISNDSAEKLSKQAALDKLLTNNDSQAIANILSGNNAKTISLSEEDFAGFAGKEIIFDDESQLFAGIEEAGDLFPQVSIQTDPAFLAASIIEGENNPVEIHEGEINFASSEQTGDWPDLAALNFNNKPQQGKEQDIAGQINQDNALHNIGQNIFDSVMAESVISDDDALQSGNNRSRTGRGAVDIFNRSHEDKPEQISNAPKKGLVDTLGLERNVENKEGPRRAEARGRRGDRFTLDVHDQRTINAGQNNSQNNLNLSNVFNVRAEKANVEIPVELNLNSGRAISENSGNAISGGNSRFEHALAQELNGNLNANIVREATVFLRNGGEGIIRLSLRPETLGDVKIRLEMSENKIKGHIIVESMEAFRAFERELPVLEKAFQDSGFGETSLDMFMAQDNGSFNPEKGQDGDFPDGNFPVSQELAASRYESETDLREIPNRVTVDLSGRASVNMLI